MVLSKKVVFRKPREVSIEEEDLPSPSRGQVLIKTLVTLISAGTELTMLSGDYPKGSIWSMMNYPCTPGYSNCGIVVEVGEDVKEVNVGDRVLSFAGHSEYVLVDVDRILAKVPEEVSDEEAAFGTLAATSMNAVRLARISLGECVVIVGMGILGQLTAQFCKLSGGFPVIAIDISEKRLEIAKKLGVIVTLNPRRDNVENEISFITEGQGADVVFEVTGSPEVIPWALNLVKPIRNTFPPESGRPVLGRYVQLSSPRGPSTIDFHDQVNFPSRIIIGAHESSHPVFETPYNPWTRRKNIKLFFELIKAGMVDVKGLVTHKYPLSEAKYVYEKLLDPAKRLNMLGILFDQKNL
ncbi:MAG: zinc-binding dehydrogenase [candidate division WOR-3 bacterium]|nr:zinc-binding dehydrogenase [Thermoproteota archaeon]